MESENNTKQLLESHSGSEETWTSEIFSKHRNKFIIGGAFLVLLAGAAYFLSGRKSSSKEKSKIQRRKHVTIDEEKEDSKRKGKFDFRSKSTKLRKRSKATDSRNHKRLISSGGQSDIDFEYQDSDNDQKSNFKGVDSAVESTSKKVSSKGKSSTFKGQPKSNEFDRETIGSRKAIGTKNISPGMRI